MSAAFLAVAVTLLGLAATGIWFGVNRRRKEETTLGIQALANMKWRQCISLVLEALIREGYAAESKESSASEDSEHLLLRDGKKVLLAYKHGTAYQISATDVRDFANQLGLKGAVRGLLITLGSTNATAIAIATRHDVEILDGATLWSKLKPYLPESTQAVVASQALAQSRKGLTNGAFASLGLGIGVFLVANIQLPSGSVVAADSLRTVSAAPAAKPSEAENATRLQLDEARKALAEIASLTDQDRARRRAEAAKQISSITQVETAVWSAQSTLLVTLSQSDGKDQHLIDEACRVLVGYEELRYSRLQLDPPQGSALPVRWRQCN
jgi:hypothetical protein